MVETYKTVCADTPAAFAHALNRAKADGGYKVISSGYAANGIWWAVMEAQPATRGGKGAGKKGADPA